MGLVHRVCKDEVRRPRRALELYMRCELESKLAHTTRVTRVVPIGHVEENIGGN